MKRLRRLVSELIRSKALFFLLITLTILSLNLTPLITCIFHSPLGRTFALIHNNVQDFFFYLGLMNEGANGAWLTYIPYTTEPHQPSIIFAYFLWLGKLSHLLGLSYAVTYHFIRIIFSLLFLSSIFYLLSSIIKVPYPRLAFFFFLLAAPFMHVVNIYGKNTSVPFMYWWTAMDPIRRVAYLPHHMVGGLLLVLTIIFFIKYFQQISNIKNYKYILWAVLLSLLLAFIHPPSLLIILVFLLISILVYLPIQFFTDYKKKLLQFPNYLITQLFNYPFIGLLAYWLIGLLFLFLMVSLTSKDPVWQHVYTWEKNQQLPIGKDIVGAFGVLFPLALIGSLYALLSGRFEYILILSWFAVPPLLLPFAQKLGIANTRLIQGVPYLPLAILSTIGLKAIIGLMRHVIARTPTYVGGRSNPVQDRHAPAKRGLAMTKTCISVVIFIFLIFTLPTLFWSIKDQLREYQPIFGNVYFDNRLKNAFTFINQNFPKKAVTLSTIYTGNYLPAFTHTVSFIGHFGYTYNVEEKNKLSHRFFEGKMTAEEAKKFLLDNKIDLVFQGPEEKPIYSHYLYPQILKPVYDRDEATIYILK